MKAEICVVTLVTPLYACSVYGTGYITVFA